MENFKVFNDEALGRIFMPEGFSYEQLGMLHISPYHGRAVALKVSDFEWISVKGGGWNLGGPQIYLSKKDEELIFGLYPFISADRELRVSRELEKISDNFPKVLYYKKISDYGLPREYDFLSSVRFKNGEPVDPCLLYTQVKTPCRIADLMYFTDEQKLLAVKRCCKFWDIDVSLYTRIFTQILAENVAVMHKYGFINDTLDYGNVTLLAEIIDYEWVTAPNVKLLDGTYGLILTDARREKEILYGVEVCLQLKALLHEKYNFYDIYRSFIESYKKINPQFIENNAEIKKILDKKRFVL